MYNLSHMGSKLIQIFDLFRFLFLKNASLLKALNHIENPVKEKHVRNIILGTCYEKSALPFWYGAIKLQLKGNAIICWKFCYTLHKLIRDGYSSVRIIEFHQLKVMRSRVEFIYIYILLCFADHR